MFDNILELEFLPHLRTACLVGDLVPGHFCWNCALRAKYSTWDKQPPCIS